MSILAETIVAEQQVLGVDYACRAYKYLGFIQIEKILRREDAIKAQWIGDKYDTDTASPVAVEKDKTLMQHGSAMSSSVTCTTTPALSTRRGRQLAPLTRCSKPLSRRMYT